MSAWDLPCDSEPKDDTIIPFPGQTSGRVVYLSLWRGAVAVKRGPTMAQIAQEVADKYGLTVTQLKGSGRAYWISHPRQEAMARMRLETDNSTTAIGRFFGGRDHTTVLHALQKQLARSDVVRWQLFGCSAKNHAHGVGKTCEGFSNQPARDGRSGVKSPT